MYSNGVWFHLYEKGLEIDSGDGYTKLWMYLVPLNYILYNAWNGKKKKSQKKKSSAMENPNTKSSTLNNSPSLFFCDDP